MKRRPYRRPVVLAGTVTADGTLALEPSDQRQLAKLGAGTEVFVTVKARPHVPPSKALRGYYFAALVDLAMFEFGYVTKDEAHEAVVKWICCNWWEQARPSLGDEERTHDEMAEIVDRMCAELLMRWGIEVPDAEVDPVRRYELTGR